ncbi:hypothetical protein LEP1GSC120_0408 [Leptospira santarosai str. 200702252]|nr:hypothetical protein [Leptospira santarosai]EMO73055.1 hypothetical protein LEP1GSC130_2392 [Leptospira santarosai str. 200403458]EMO97401.1 hypothetical protein LEP1GSC120_0408 [Leptospira santarosai str. 200702252]
MRGKMKYKYVIFILFTMHVFCLKENELKSELRVDNKCAENRTEMEKHLKSKWGSDYQMREFSKITAIIDDQGTIDDKILEYTCCFPNLVSLTASRSKDITDFGVRKFVECRLKNNNQRMHEINFQATSITNESIKSLSQLSGIGTFYLDENRINNDSIPYFAKFKSIGQLSIVATDITEAGAEQLRKMKHIVSVDSEYHKPEF